MPDDLHPVSVPVKPLVRVTQIGEYIKHQSCERRFKLDHEPGLTKALPFFFQLSSTMDPVLSEAGRRREREWENGLAAAGLADLCRYNDRPDEAATSWALFAERCVALTPGQAAYAREIEVEGDIGAFRVSGRVDFVLVLWSDGRPILRLVECKASRKDKTHQRIQLATYRQLVGDLLRKGPLHVGGQSVGPDAIECVVARLEESSNAAQDMRTLPPLNVSLEVADIHALLAPGGPLLGILARDIDQLPYQLEAKCDDCAMHVYCLPEAARGRRLQLLGLDAGAVRALEAVGVGDLDTLAALAPDGQAAAQLRAHPDFTTDLDTLHARALARLSTLPGGMDPGKMSDVVPLPHAGSGQLPPHLTGASRLIRVFLSVSYDYVENRVGAIAAHVTRSDKPFSTLFASEEGRWRPDPDVKEQWAVGKDDAGRTTFADRPLEGIEIAGVMPRPWSGDFDADSRREADLLQRAFTKIVEAAQSLCPEGRAPVHFYVWSQQEVTRLIEACARGGGDLLGSLRQLLGCRESLEQLIYSCLGDEVNARYALAWTGRGLAPATSLRWFGRRFHWTRRVGDEVLALDKVFAAGIFDFKTTLPYDDAGGWLPLTRTAEGSRAVFEVHSCFTDALPAPYWRAQWGTLPDDADATPSMRASIAAYKKAAQPGILKAYLKARTQALRWIEESITHKNVEIAKPPIDLKALPDFTLGVRDAARAALDFLWLEQHVATSDWLAAHLIPPISRVPSGRTLPLRDIHAVGDNQVAATISVTPDAPSLPGQAARCSLAPGAFVRISPMASDDPHRAQSVAQLVRGGSTCVIDTLDWSTGRVELSVMPFRNPEDRYILPSRAWPMGGAGLEWATLDEGLSDFVAGRIDTRLQSGRGAHLFSWFDPLSAMIPPQSPPSPAHLAAFQTFLAGLDLGNGPLAPDQAAAALHGLSARVQLLQGPPGTGKTQTTAAAVLLRILARRAPGEIVLLAANTHTAVDTLLRRLAAQLDAFTRGASDAGLSMPPVRLAKLSASGAAPLGSGICEVDARSTSELDTPAANAVLVIGGTPSGLLKMAGALDSHPPFNGDMAGFQSPMLVADEASMMALPSFFAVASLVRPDGEILLAGDHRQLAPIMAHDWEREERPPVALYQPHVSAYEAVRSLKARGGLADSSVLQSALSFTFRLPPVIRRLIARVYELDGITLTGFEDRAGQSTDTITKASIGWNALWSSQTGLFLVVHDECESRQVNPLEAEIIKDLLHAAGPQPDGSVGIVVPHRAQRALLQMALAENGCISVIDTVERLQGGERPTIIVSATASDPAAISARAEFLLGLNRANVAFSRAQRRLIVVCSDRLLAHIPAASEHYAEALLWKGLRASCSVLVSEQSVGKHRVQIWTPPAQ